MTTIDTKPARRASLGLILLGLWAVAACAASGPGDPARHRWWAGLGPVIPHDDFPGDCTLCHVGDSWNELRDDFSFDHAAETGVTLRGAHARARCLRCHNDRGPVADFMAQGCGGCHGDIHQGELGPRCEECHTEDTWQPFGQLERHARTRLPLIGAHAVVACYRCHPGALVGNFLPADPNCLTCHREELAATTNPPHLPLGWVDRCDRCHLPTSWRQGSVR
ncbi:MAG: hypothetical protein IPM29_21540 [Planctomycetes bacterium]|nr:hypothetical protein [Planctomycetota bacterium]